MEIVIILAIIVVICLVLGIGVSWIMIGLAALAGLFCLFMALFFTYYTVRLLFARRREARFLHFVPYAGGRFEAALYEVEGKEYPNVFLKEGIMDELLYPKDKTVHVMLHRKMGRVYDRFAFATCVLGFVFSVCLSFVIVYIVVTMVL